MILDRSWPTIGRFGYITPSVWEISNVLEQGTKSELAHRAHWLDNAHPLGCPQRFRAGHNHNWCTSGRIGCIRCALYRFPIASKRGQNQNWATSGPNGYITLAVYGVLNASQRGKKTKLAQKWVDWLHNGRRVGGP